MSVLARWRKRLAERKERLALAKKDYRKAQEAYEQARRVDLHPRMQYRLARDKALDRLRLRRRQVQSAQRIVARHSAPKRPVPERTSISPNRSSRNGQTPKLIVLHITVSHNRQGLSDIDAILSYFKQPSTRASSHVVNDAEGNDARCVPDEDKAWTQAAYNPVSLSIEQIEYSVSRKEREWMVGNKRQLENTAQWVAWWSHKYGIPLVKSTTHGVCQHSDLGAAGGGHSDCGPGYPFEWVLERARELRGLS